MTSRRHRKRLIFDLGGVIVDHDNDKCYRRLGDLLIDRPTRAELAAFITSQGVGTGAVTADELFERLRGRFGSTASQAQFLDAWTCHFTLKEDVRDLMLSIRGERPLVICSNTNAAHWDYLERVYRLGELAFRAILSHEVGCEKPEAGIYLAAAAAHGAGPRDCLFVDDVEINVAGARALGFDAHLFVGADALRAALER